MSGRKKTREAFSSMLRISHPLSKDEILIVFDLLFFEKEEEKRKQYWKKIYCFRSKYREMRRIVSQIFISRKIDGKNSL